MDGIRKAIGAALPFVFLAALAFLLYSIVTRDYIAVAAVFLGLIWLEAARLADWLKARELERDRNRD